jgi:hypothetical protein
VPYELKNSKSFMLKLVAIDPKSINNASNSLKYDEDIILTVAKQDIKVLHLHKLDDPRLISKLLDINPLALQYVPVTYHSKDIIFKAIKKNPFALEHVYLKWSGNKALALEAVKQDGYLLKHVKSQTLEICMAAVQKNGNALKYVKHIYRTPEICNEAVKQNPKAIKYFP